jgi:hypothetical protein
MSRHEDYLRHFATNGRDIGLDEFEGYYSNCINASIVLDHRESYFKSNYSASIMAKRVFA